MTPILSLRIMSSCPEIYTAGVLSFRLRNLRKRYDDTSDPYDNVAN